ncbi:CNH-domain-containing protein [Auriculariales sp. MPI-PUGE-AT-0066]|nr:CNH-domain-containing protein [Auriculariales sp. MPI-PUGE-AT-0066]
MESRLLDDREFTPSPSASISNSTTSAEQLATPSTVARSNSAVHQSQPRRSTELTGPRPHNGTVSGHGHSHSQSITGANTKRLRQPLVYPAMLSRVAAALQSRLPLITHIKDGLEYTDAFTGRDAVDKIAYIIKTTDRNLALLLGRALDAQKFFHDVTYDHRLRDSSSEIYRFSTRVAPWGSGEINGVAETTEHDDACPTDDADGEQNLPVGVFTLLTDCYSPTCSRDRLCYSISCPRRVEQQRRQHLKPSGGLRQPAQEILDAAEDPADDAVVETGTLWIHSVPQEVVDSVSDTEKKRQEAINEVMYTERDFVRDVEYLRDVWMKPLLDGSGGVDLADSATFVHNVFWNVADILAVNTKLRDALTKRQKAYAVVDRIGDILLEHVPFFDPFVAYGAHQLLAKVEFEREKAANPSFAVFVEEAERRPESRKLELNAYLTKPTTRLARYPLLLGVALKYTPDDHPDKEDLPKVITMIREFLEAVNQASGKAENAYNIQQLAAQLQFRPGEEVPLRLEDPHRELIFKGQMKRRGGSAAETGDLQIFLFDHAIVMAKQKTKIDALRVVRRPIPLELLVVSCPDDPHASVPSAKQIENKQGFPITFAHLGRKGYTVMLFASTFVARRKWVEHITKQQETLRARSLVFDTTVLSDRFFAPDSGRRVYCAVPFNAGRRVAFGTQDGVYLADLHEEQATQPKHILLLPDVVQVEVLEAQQVLLVLSERTVFAYALDNIDERDPRNNVQLQRRVSSHINFFRAGTCLGKTLVCVVKTSALSSTIRALEPVDGTIRGRSKTTFRKWVQGTNDALRPYKEFYIPLESSSLHFLKSRICIGCTKGFEIVDLQSLETQGLLDPSDSTLDFVKRREGLVRPMAIFRVDQDFLLCYDEFAFYVNKNGWRARNRFIIFWEGTPSSFALHYPYVLAFEPSFIEVRHVENGALMQVIQGSNLRCLFAENPPSTTNTANSQYSTQHYPARTPYGIAAPGTPYSGRQSVYSQFGTGGPNYGYVHGQDRDEIIMVSEDRVMALRLADQSELQPAVPLQPAAQMSVQNLPQMVAQMSMQQSPAPMPMHALSSAHGHHPQQGPPPQAQMWAAASAPNMYAGPPHGGSPIHHNGNGPYQHPQASYSQTFYGR